MHLSDYEVDRSKVRECLSAVVIRARNSPCYQHSESKEFESLHRMSSQLHPGEMGMPTDDTKEFQALNPSPR